MTPWTLLSNVREPAPTVGAELVDLARMPVFWAAIFGALGVWLLLPRGGRPGWRVGLVLAAFSLVGFLGFLPPLENWLENCLFHAMAAIAVAASVATITARSPVYSAVWFAVVLMGVAGLFMFQGAQFLGVATVVVYAGAILVTFLFVLMLAQPDGHTYYDRLSWEGLLSSATGAVLVGILALQLSDAATAEGKRPREMAAAIKPAASEILAEDHVARLGGRLFSEYLVAVEVAGVMLLAALVGAVTIIEHGRQTPDRTTRNVPSKGSGHA